MEEVKPTKGLDAPVEAIESELLEALNESNGIAAISLLRIYDVLMCLYAEKNFDDAQALADLHNKGQIRAKLPWLNLTSQSDDEEASP